MDWLSILRRQWTHIFQEINSRTSYPSQWYDRLHYFHGILLDTWHDQSVKKLHLWGGETNRPTYFFKGLIILITYCIGYKRLFLVYSTFTTTIISHNNFFLLVRKCQALCHVFYFEKWEAVEYPICRCYIFFWRNGTWYYRNHISYWPRSELQSLLYDCSNLKLMS